MSSVKITLIEFDEVKTFNPLKFWKGCSTSIVETNFSTAVFPFVKGEVSIFDIYNIRSFVERALTTGPDKVYVQPLLVQSMVNALKPGHPIAINTEADAGHHINFIMELSND